MDTTKIIDAIVELEQKGVKREDMVLLMPYAREVYECLLKDEIKYSTGRKEHDSFWGILMICDPYVRNVKVKSIVSPHEVFVFGETVQFEASCKCGYKFDISDGNDMCIAFCNCPKCGEQSVWDYKSGKYVEVVGGLW